MNSRRRSSLLLLLLPGLVAGTAYIYLGKPRLEAEARAAAEALDKLRTRVPLPAEETALSAREAGLRDELKTLEGNAVEESSSGSGEKLALLLRRHRLLLLEEMLDPSGALAPTGFEKSRLRQLKLDGRYLDVLSALRGLTDPSIGAVPLRLVMAREGAEVRWTLLLWM